MDDVRIGSTIRAIRIRKHLRQSDVARRAGVSRQLVGRLEAGAVGRYPLDTVRGVAGALGVRLDVRPRWQGADLDRVLNAAHASMHTSVSGYLGKLDGWAWLPEVTFSHYGERGVIDILAWHAASRTLLIIELKTELVDPQELVAAMHRRVRLGKSIAREQGWDPVSVSAWVIIQDGRTDRRRVGKHEAILRRAFPHDGRFMRRWMRSPAGTASALSFWTDVTPGGARHRIGSVKRVTARPGHA